MTFGRMNNLVRRPVRPDRDYHRTRRRNRCDHMLALKSERRPSLLRSFFSMLGLVRR